MPTRLLPSELATLEPGRLRLLAQKASSGLSLGQHRSARKGSGVEFAGHRAYLPGDDLRHLDRHALLRFGKHLVREFSTETERVFHFVVDATPSMIFPGSALEERSKLHRACLLTAALALLARRSGDPFGLSLILGERGQTTGSGLREYYRPASGHEQFERVLSALETLLSWPSPEPLAAEFDSAQAFRSAVLAPAASLPAGSAILLMSDFLDPLEVLRAELGGLLAGKRQLLCLQLLSPEERELPGSGVRSYLPSEGGATVSTDPDRVRTLYQTALNQHTQKLKEDLLRQGGLLLESSTDQDPADTLRLMTRALALAPR